ncbi:hypothetical protein [Polycladidibacter hongkongensis]|uniref:hypothetical protein n=1 Tax=Polycladidibacter hongkongensis TaxID=1647556 RepID=UPI0008356E25|nr:hypothetical protein [Pseudovibrio hongkongensis]
MQENTTKKWAVTVTALTDRRRGGLKFLKNQPVTVPFGEGDEKLLETLMADPILNMSAPFELEPEGGDKGPNTGDDAAIGRSEPPETDKQKPPKPAAKPRNRKPATKAPTS